MSEAVRELGDADLASAVKTGVSLIDFYGTWCPPCKLLAPVVEKLAGEYAGRALVAKVDVDDNSESAVDNRVENIPTLVFFKDGEEKQRLVGNQSIETLRAELDKLLA